MRTLLALALLGLAGFLIWHGIDTSDAAKVELDLQKSKIGPARNFETLFHRYPYSTAATDARELDLEDQLKPREGLAAGKTPGKEELKTLGKQIPDRTKRGFSGEKPYVQPDAAAIVGLAGLLLALVLPGTRFRGLAFLGLLLGGAAAAAAMLPVQNQVGLVNQFQPLKYVIINFPRVAQACVALAAITLASRFRGGPARTSS